MSPTAREVWYVDDSEVRLHVDKRILKGKRPVLIACSSSLLTAQSNIINVVPLTTHGSPDRLCFPITQAYERTFGGFLPDPNSLALIQFYQPIDVRYFDKNVGKIGVVDVVSYNTILQILCSEVIGYTGFDFSP
jgi:hypothetical protein